MRDDRALGMTVPVGTVNTWLDSGHIVKVEPIGFADRLYVGHERKESRFVPRAAGKMEEPSTK